MRSLDISSTIFAVALVLATPADAADAGFLLGHPPGLRVVGELEGSPTSSDSGSEPSEKAPHEAAPAGRESDWLANPPDPDRHNLWVPTAEWAVCLTLTIPLFMIDPAFVNTGTVSGDHFADAWSSPPVWDSDGAIANYLLHPIMGAEAYLMVRNRDYGPVESFLFATGVSVAWEYLFEAWVEQPSTQDLLVTSPIGSVMGEVLFQLRGRVARWDRSIGRDALLILIDPIEAIHRYVGKEFLNDEENETADSSWNVGPDRAGWMLTLQF